jgi:hypothetical protein
MTVSILGMKYKLSYETSEQMKGELGMCTPWKLDIRINKEAPGPQQEETLIHEVLHCISDELVLELNEETIQRLSAGLHSCGCRVRVDK